MKQILPGDRPAARSPTLHAADERIARRLITLTPAAAPSCVSPVDARRRRRRHPSPSVHERVPDQTHAQEQQARTRATLMASATRILARRGCAARRSTTSTADAGFTKGAFYANFASKERCSSTSSTSTSPSALRRSTVRARTARPSVSRPIGSAATSPSRSAATRTGAGSSRVRRARHHPHRHRRRVPRPHRPSAGRHCEHPRTARPRTRRHPAVPRRRDRTHDVRDGPRRRPRAAPGPLNARGSLRVDAARVLRRPDRRRRARAT